jgi:hypothetical protein
MRLEIASRNQQPVRRITRQAQQMADQIERLRYLRRWLRIVPRNNRWAIPSWPSAMTALAALAAVAAAVTAILMWREF